MAKRHNTPKFLPDDQKVKWNALYDTGLKQAKMDMPDDENAQHTAALKAANKMLLIAAPTSAKEIAKLPDWQVHKREERTIDGVRQLTLVTIDGRKYKFPVEPEKPAAA